MSRYNFKTIEEKWQNFWLKKKIFKSKIDKGKKKFYCLEMFPYPSGKIHMGHVRNYTIGDVLSTIINQLARVTMFCILWVGIHFGMPAENAAKVKIT